jgi:hypothetical protein
VSLRDRLLLRWMSAYPPYLGAGVRVRVVDEAGELVAEVDKLLSVRVRRPAGAAPAR